MVANGCKWSQMVTNGLKRSQVVANGGNGRKRSQWSLTVANCRKLSQTIANGRKRSKIVAALTLAQKKVYLLEYEQ